jgi:hypothetical protein
MKPRPIPLALAAGLFCWIFAEALFGSGVFVFRDAGHYYYPLLKFVRDQWLSGRVPLWNPYENLGTPLAANATACVFYPGTLLLLLPISYAWAYKLVILGHVALAAWSTCCLARETKSSREAATLAAISYAFSGSVLFQYTNFVFLVAAAWLPLALLAAQRMLVRRQVRWALAFGAVLAMIVLGGDPQTAYHAVLLVALYAWTLWRADRRAAGQDVRFHISNLRFRIFAFFMHSRPMLLATACIAAFLLAAVQILPAVEFARRSGRSHSSLPRSVYEIPGYLLSPPAGPPQADSHWTDALTCRRLEPLSHHEDVYQFSVGPWRLAEFLWPNLSGRQFPVHRRWLDVLPAEGRVWSPSLYMGLLPLLLALSAMRFRRADPRIVWWSWSVVLAVLAAFGWFGPGWLLNEVRIAAGGDPARPWLVGPPCGGLYWLASVFLPGYIYFRYPAKLLSIAALGLSMLAAEGWDRAASGGRHTECAGYVGGDVARIRRWLLGLAGLSLLGAGVAVGVRPWWPQWLGSVRPDPVFGPLDAMGAVNDLLLAMVQTAAVGLVAWWLLGRLRTGGGLSRFWAPCEAWSDENGPLPLRRARVLPVLLLLTAVDLGLANRWMVATAPAGDWQTPSPLAQRIRQDALSREVPQAAKAPRQKDPAGNALRGVPGDEENRISPLAAERHRGRSLQSSSSTFRVYRDPFLLPPSWQQRSSADRLAESLRWDCRTLAPKHNLSAGVRLANVAGTMMDYDYEMLLEIPLDKAAIPGRDLPDLPFSLPLGLELTGARYLVLPAMSPEDRARFAAGAHVWPDPPPVWLDTPGEETVSLWFNPAALPRAWIVHHVQAWLPLASRDPCAVRSQTTSVLVYRLDRRDLRWLAFVEAKEPVHTPSFRGKFPGNADAEPCSVADVNPERVEIEADLAHPGLVVLGDQYDPGWQVEVRTEGQRSRPATILQTDRVLRGVWLPAGRHRLVYTYRPAMFYLGAAISLLAWLALGVVLLASRRRLSTAAS